MYTLNAGILANPGFVEQFATETTAAGKPAIAADIMAGWGSILPVGQFLANVLLPFLSARYGCKAAFAVCWTFLAANIIDEGQSRRWGHCLVAKLLAGIGLGCLRCTLPMYIAEVAPTRIRGTVLMTNNLWWTVGTFFAYLAMERLSQGVEVFDVEHQIEVLSMLSNHVAELAATQKREKWYVVFRGTDGFRTIVALWTIVLQQFTGLALFSTFGASSSRLGLALYRASRQSITSLFNLRLPGVSNLRLPDACSPDTCFVTATETANIMTKHLERAPVTRVLAPHFAIYTFVNLAPEYWTLVNVLDIMDKRRTGHPAQPALVPGVLLAGSLASQLQELYDLSEREPVERVLVLLGQEEPHLAEQDPSPDPLHSINHAKIDLSPQPRTGHLSGDSADSELSTIFGETTARRIRPAKRPREGDWIRPELPIAQVTTTGADMQPGPPGPLIVPSENVPGAEQGVTDELLVISHGLLDEGFLEMNRIINFDNFRFMTNVDEGLGRPEWIPLHAARRAF
ncbi:hypothetical protein BJX62DRAFT_238359 [Aspergillus germanicus]